MIVGGQDGTLAAAETCGRSRRENESITASGPLASKGLTPFVKSAATVQFKVNGTTVESIASSVGLKHPERRERTFGVGGAEPEGGVDV